MVGGGGVGWGWGAGWLSRPVEHAPSPGTCVGPLSQPVSMSGSWQPALAPLLLAHQTPLPGPRAASAPWRPQLGLQAVRGRGRSAEPEAPPTLSGQGGWECRGARQHKQLSQQAVAPRGQQPREQPAALLHAHPKLYSTCNQIIHRLISSSLFKPELPALASAPVSLKVGRLAGSRWSRPASRPAWQPAEQ